MRLSAIVLIGLALGATQGGAQEAVRGRVVLGPTGAPITGAAVRVLGGGPATLSGPDGRFRLPGPIGPGDRLVTAAIGYSPDTTEIGGGVPGAEPLLIRLRPAALALDAIVVAATAGARAGERVLADLDHALRPRQSSQELLELVPGMVIAQHAGGGKAEQLLLRGFDADHGTDVAISVDEVPINLVSHAHGQGYADLHFLLPEVVERVESAKGGHDPRDGNLATAGAVRFTTRDRLGTGTLRARLGRFGTIDLLGTIPLGRPSARSGGYLALGRLGSDGPFDHPQRHRRHNAFGRWTAPVGDGARLTLTASAFDASWSASGQIPERAVRAGAIGRFGAIDPTEGSTTRRLDFWATASSASDAIRPWRVGAWVTQYRLDLFSNFTFFRDDPDRGDGIEQLDDRIVTGAHATASAPTRVAGRFGRLAGGLTFRSDFIDLLLAAQRERVRGAPRVAAGITEHHGGAWLGHRLAVTDRLDLDTGLRVDRFQFAVTDRRHEEARRSAAATRLSPRLGLELRPHPGTVLSVRASRAFHSNDARSAVAPERELSAVPAASTVEMGIRHASASAAVALALWRSALESELVYVGDEGTTEPSGRTVRRGVELEARARLRRWLWVDADLALVRGRLVDQPPGANRIPLAPGRVAAGGIAIRDAGPVAAAVRLRHVASRPADETGEVVARGHTLAEASASWRWRALTLSARIENLFDVEWNEAQFATTSRLRSELEPVTELHFTPGSPRRLEVVARLDW